MIEKIDINRSPIESELSSRQPNSAGALPDNDADVSVQVNYASLIDQATQSPQTDTQLVQQARELLLSGELESLPRIRDAIEDILAFGI
ncbi:MAG: hypothetical protein ACYS80_05930 [Planctomycetota bacterium]|jgi:hypothetical protein